MTRPQPTVSERDRWSWFQDVGCLPCRIEGRFDVPAQHCHETRGGRRTGHRFSFPGCPWHHQGYAPEGMDPEQATALYGPSFAVSKRSFTERYGTERELSDRTDAIIAGLKLRRVG